MGSSPQQVKPPKVNYDKDIRKLLEAYQKNMPGIMSFEETYRPMLQGLNLGDISSFLNGSNGQDGIFGLTGQAAQQAGQALGNARAQDFGQMTGQAGAYRDMMGAISPEAAGQVQLAQGLTGQSLAAGNRFSNEGMAALGQYQPDTSRAGSTVGDINPNVNRTVSLGTPSDTMAGYNPNVGTTISNVNANAQRSNQMANEAYVRSRGLTGQESRLADQQVREAFGARGMLDSNSSVAAEVLNRDSVLQGKRNEAYAADDSSYRQNMGVAQQRTATEQALFGQRADNALRDLNARASTFSQRLGSGQLGLQQQSELYNQGASNVDRGLGLAGLAFNQDLAARSQQMGAQGQGFGQFMNFSQQEQAMREEAARRNEGAYGLAQGFYTQPGLAALGSMPLSYQAGQQQLGIGLGAIGAGTPQLYDISAALNMGAAQRQNVIGAQSANAQTGASNNAALYGAGGAIAGAAIIAI